MKRINNKKGIGLIETVVAVAILSTALGAIIITFSFYLKAALQNTEVIKATYLAEEGMEAMRIFRDSSWDTYIDSLSLNTDYYLNYATTTKTWSTSSNAQSNYIDGKYQRTVRVSSVMRNSSDDIVSSGGTVDGDIKLVEVTVAWQQGEATTTRVVSGYLTNLFAN